MIINDLSVGDIVNEPYEDEYRPIQITALRDDGWEKDYKNGADDDWFDVEDLKGIELTPELLEKLGFTMGRDNNSATFPCKSTDLILFRLDRDFRKFGWLWREVISISTVDQLQHALRMSGYKDFANSLDKHFDIR